MKFFLLLTLGLFSLNSFSQLTVNISWQPITASAKNDTVYYNPGNNLNWANFQVKQEEGSDAAALTTSGFGFGAGLHSLGNKGTLNVNVFCYFLRSKSWYKERYKTSYVLNHEQHHFDIAYLSTCYFVKKLKAAKFTLRNYSSLLQSLYADAYNYMNDLQDEYDDETDNGRARGKQAEWNKRIADQLTTVTN